ncbi:MAG: DMT family transporter [Ruminococcaceae bacterium]|nr:DMT family transporter [Oscillospiraceae bacterium]
MKKYYVFAGISILCWSSMATVVKLLLGAMDSMTALFLSSLFAVLGLLLVGIFSKKLRLLRRYRWRDYLNMVLIGLPGNLLYNVFYYAGAARMPAAEAFIVNYLWPIMSVVFACILLKEKMTPAKLLGLLLSFLGVFFVIGESLFAFDVGSLAGAGLCVLGAVSYGAFCALNQKHDYDPTIATMVSYGSVAILTGAFVLCTGEIPPLRAPQLLGLAWNGGMTLGVATITWILALGAGNTAKISNLAYLTPVLSLLWTFLFLKEEIQPLALVGLGVIMLGIFIQLLWRGRAPE